MRKTQLACYEVSRKQHYQVSLTKKQNITTPLSNANQEKESINIFNLMSEIFEAKMKDLCLAMKPSIIAMPRLKMEV